MQKRNIVLLSVLFLGVDIHAAPSANTINARGLSIGKLSFGSKTSATQSSTATSSTGSSISGSQPASKSSSSTSVNTVYGGEPPWQDSSATLVNTESTTSSNHGPPPPSPISLPDKPAACTTSLGHEGSLYCCEPLLPTSIADDKGIIRTHRTSCNPVSDAAIQFAAGFTKPFMKDYTFLNSACPKPRKGNIKLVYTNKPWSSIPLGCCAPSRVKGYLDCAVQKVKTSNYVHEPVKQTITAIVGPYKRHILLVNTTPAGNDSKAHAAV